MTGRRNNRYGVRVTPTTHIDCIDKPVSPAPDKSGDT
nr:MAG TPA: hypothetical protein [Caudoviricetes sp.]